MHVWGAAFDWKRGAWKRAAVAAASLAALALSGCGRTPEPEAPQPEPPAGYAVLRAQAEREGAVRIIARIALAPGDSSPLLGRDGMIAALSSAGAEMARPLGPDLPLVVAEVDAAQLDMMAESGRVAAMAEDRLAFVSLSDSVRQVRAPEAWRAGALGRGQSIAILDTGIDARHPFFGGRVTAEACFSSASAAFNAESVCPDGSGAQIGPGAGRPCQGAAGCDHGTHVAGIAAGSGAGGLRGVAPEAELIAIQVFSRFRDVGTRTPCASSGQRSPCIAAFTSDQIRALDHVRALAADRAVAAVNMSLGGGRSAGACDGDFIAPAIQQLRALGVATVIAAGNDGFPDAVSFPGCVAAAVTVGAVDRNDQLAAFSNRGPLVDVLAPGVGIRSSVPQGGFAALSGTSMATPHVAGAFAALKSARPGAAVEEATFALASSGAQVDGRPRIDVAAALARLPTTAPTAAPPPAVLALASGGAARRATQATLAELAKRPPSEPVRVLVRPRWPARTLSGPAEVEAIERVAMAARVRGALLVDPRYGQGLVIVEATPGQLASLARSGSVGSMQEEIRATPQNNP